ncbi:hypothetical protein BU17DRAFT_82596 [Hysterangium stoloniferum]|nr:hypothetical protein BU17DRAFT_82596 [Hysterangium stoloniferum]
MAQPPLPHIANMNAAVNGMTAGSNTIAQEMQTFTGHQQSLVVELAQFPNYNMDHIQQQLAGIQASIAAIQAMQANVQATLANVQATLANVQADIQTVQASVGDLTALTTAQFWNIDARMQNAAKVDRPTQRLVPLRSIQRGPNPQVPVNTAIPNFPANANAITGMSTVACRNLLRSLGKTIPQGVAKQRTAVRKAVGLPGQVQDLENWHNHVRIPEALAFENPIPPVVIVVYFSSNGDINKAAAITNTTVDHIATSTFYAYIPNTILGMINSNSLGRNHLWPGISQILELLRKKERSGVKHEYFAFKIDHPECGIRKADVTKLSEIFKKELKDGVYKVQVAEAEIQATAGVREQAKRLQKNIALEDEMEYPADPINIVYWEEYLRCKAFSWDETISGPAYRQQMESIKDLG